MHQQSGAHVLLESESLGASASAADFVYVNVHAVPDPVVVSEWQEAFDRVAGKLSGRKSLKAGGQGAADTAMAVALAAVLSRRFSKELDQIVDAYRLMLRESLAKADDAQLQSALNRARLQEKVLSATIMVNQAQACRLLGLSIANPSATMKRREEKRELLRFTVDGRALYPLFQFDIEGRRIQPAMSRLMALTPAAWSDFRLLHWITRPHPDFGATPAERIGTDGSSIIAAFEREIVPAGHG